MRDIDIMVELTEDDAYCFGWNAAILEEFHSECPFEDKTLQDAFLHGFFEALHDSKKEMMMN